MERLFFSTAQAAMVLGLHPTTVVRLVKKGELPGRRIGRCYKLPRKAVFELAAVRCTESKT